MTDTRENWTSRSGFILAAVGSAVGLGNIWRFPYVAYENGGGAFLVPYLIAIFAAGLPLLFLDYAVGHKFRKAPPTAYKKLMNRRTCKIIVPADTAVAPLKKEAFF